MLAILWLVVSDSVYIRQDHFVDCLAIKDAYNYDDIPPTGIAYLLSRNLAQYQ